MRLRTALISLLLLMPSVAHAQGAGGALVPGSNIDLSGMWNFSNGVKTNGVLVQTATVTLADSDVLALGSTPFTVIPLCSVSPSTLWCIPTGYVAVPIYGVATFNYTSVYSAGSDLKLFYTSRTGGNAASGTITNTGFLDTAASNNEVFTGVIAGPEPGKTARAVVLQGTALTAFAGGAGANRLTIQVQFLLYPTGSLN